MEQRVRDLEERVARLERTRAEPPPPAVPSHPDGPLGLLDTLRGRSGPQYARADRAGAVAYAGAASFADGEHLWAAERPVPEVLDADFARVARVLECLGSPARLALLATMIGAVRGRGELQQALGDTTSGHLYHHLRDLAAAGLLAPRRRGEHQVSAQAVVPLLTIIAAALDLAGGAGGADGQGGAGGADPETR